MTLAVSAYCSQVVVWFDSALYHVQAIKWLSEFGMVPGLALIHSRFGFISSWFALPAPFNHGVLAGRIMTLPGALCLLLLVAQGLVALARIAGQQARRHDHFMAVAFLFTASLALVWGIPNSPSPDFPVIVLVVVVAWTMLAISGREVSHIRPESTIQAELIPLVLAVGAVSIKLSALPLIIVSGCFYLFRCRPNVQKILTAFALVVCLLAPVAIAGVIVSGCAFYPMSLLCVDTAWSLGAAVAESESTIIREWARWGGNPTPAHATAWNWILPWLGTEKVCAALILTSSLSAISLVVFRAGRTNQNGYVMALGVTGIFFMLYGAPTWRFGLGYLVVLPALAVANSGGLCSAMAEKLSKINALKSFGIAGSFAAVIITFHVHAFPRPSYRLLDEALAGKLVPSEDHPHFNLWLPPRPWNLNYELDNATGKTRLLTNLIIQGQSENIIYSRPENPDRSVLCWDAPLPCAPTMLEKIKLRNQYRGIAEGFEKIIEVEAP